VQNVLARVDAEELWAINSMIVGRNLYWLPVNRRDINKLYLNYLENV